MWYVYILRSKKNNKLYVGYTDNLRRRFTEHNLKRGGGCTSKNAPFDLIFYEAFMEKKDATKDELFFKSGYGRGVLKSKLENYFKNNK